MVPGDDFVVHSSWLWCEGCINGRVTSHTISVLKMCLKHLKRKCSDMYFFLSTDGVYVSTNEFHISIMAGSIVDVLFTVHGAVHS